MTIAWIPVNTSKSPTAASAQLRNEIAAAYGEDATYGLGQGAEQDMPPQELQIAYQGSTSCKYQAEAGGPMAAREAVARFGNKFFGFPADGSNTYLLKAQGRDGLGKVMEVVNILHMDANPEAPSPVNIVDELHWPMYGIVGKGKGQLVAPQSKRAELMNGVSRFITEIVNDPNNPTGAMMTLEEHIALRQRDLEVPGHIHHTRVYDNPYGYAGKPNEKGNYIGPDHSKFLSQNDDPANPWAIDKSFSKYLATATPGFCALIVHPSFNKPLTDVLTASNGLAYEKSFMDAIPGIFAEENDEIHLGHMSQLRAKYTTNRTTLNAFNMPLLPGEPCMTAALDVQDLLGRKLTTDRFGDVEVKTINDLVAVLANVAQVITVAQSPKGLLRVALAASPMKFREGVERMDQVFTQLRSAPQLAA